MTHVSRSRIRCLSILDTSPTRRRTRKFLGLCPCLTLTQGVERYHSLVSQSTITSANSSWSRSGGCRDQIQSCYTTGATSTCSKAQSFCNNNILSPLVGPYDVYFVLARDPDPYPPSLSTYLGNAALKSKIGAESNWAETSDAVYDNFASTGDWMTNSRPHLETVINAGVRTIVYDGDAVRVRALCQGFPWLTQICRTTS